MVTPFHKCVSVYLRMRMDTKASGSLRLILLTVLGSVAAGCSSAPPPPTTESAALVIHGAGSTFSSVLFDRWATAYYQLHPDTAVRYDSVGSGEGVRRFLGQSAPAEQAVDFGASDSAMSDEERHFLTTHVNYVAWLAEGAAVQRIVGA